MIVYFGLGGQRILGGQVSEKHKGAGKEVVDCLRYGSTHAWLIGLKYPGLGHQVDVNLGNGAVDISTIEYGEVAAPRSPKILGLIVLMFQVSAINQRWRFVFFYFLLKMRHFHLGSLTRNIVRQTFDLVVS
jgi:hypothetical protein